MANRRRQAPNGDGTDLPGRQSADRVLRPDFRPRQADELEIEHKWLLAARLDPREFFRFFDKYHERIYLLVYYRTGDADLADDLTSQTFYQAMDKLWQFRFRGLTFGAWLYRIAINLLNMNFRGAAGRETADDGELEMVPTQEPGPLEQLMAREDSERLSQCMDRLSEKGQILLILFYWENLRIREIATILDMQPIAVKTALHRERKRLGRMLIRLGNGPEPPFPPDLKIIEGGTSS